MLIAALVLAALSLFNMLLYRHGHKTTIESDLLLKQMRITSRLWTGMGIYRDYLHELDKFHEIISERWDNTRQRIKTLYGHDMGPLPAKPVMDGDVASKYTWSDRPVGQTNDTDIWTRSSEVVSNSWQSSDASNAEIKGIRDDLLRADQRDEFEAGIVLGLAGAAIPFFGLARGCRGGC